MQKWLILWLWLLLGGCLAAAAQAPAAQLLLAQEPSAPLLMFVRVAPAQLPPASVAPAPQGKALVGLTAVLALSKSPDQGLVKRLLSIEVVKTMFATESRVPIAQLPGGRLQLDGFTSTYHMKNLLLGPSGLGHPGIRAPRSARVYGIRLSFRLGRAL